MGNVRTAGAECAGCFFYLPGAIFSQSIGCIFSSLIDDLFFAFFGSMEVWRSLSVLLRVRRRKKDLRDPKMPLRDGKRNEKSALAGLGGRKSCARPEKAEKTGLGD